MSLENGKCANCGCILVLDDSKESGVCKYCGNELNILQALRKYKTEGINKFEFLILTADQAIKYREDYDTALDKYKQALNIRPDDYRIYWGIFLCEIDLIKKRCEKDCLSAVIADWGRRAYELAPEKTKPYYLQKLREAEK